MIYLTCCISIVVSPSWRSSSFTAYCGSALVKTMLSSLLPLVFICFSQPWHLLFLKLGFSTKLHLHCLHLPRVCGLCHHPPLSNFGNVSNHYLAGSNKTGCWSSFVCFVANSLISPILPSLPFVLILSLVVSTVFGKHCECIAQKRTHLGRLPPLVSHLLLLRHCVLTWIGGKKKVK